MHREFAPRATRQSIPSSYPDISMFRHSLSRSRLHSACYPVTKELVHMPCACMSVVLRSGCYLPPATELAHHDPQPRVVLATSMAPKISLKAANKPFIDAPIHWSQLTSRRSTPDIHIRFVENLFPFLSLVLRGMHRDAKNKTLLAQLTMKICDHVKIISISLGPV